MYACMSVCMYICIVDVMAAPKTTATATAAPACGFGKCVLVLVLAAAATADCPTTIAAYFQAKCSFCLEHDESF